MIAFNPILPALDDERDRTLSSYLAAAVKRVHFLKMCQGWEAKLHSTYDVLDYPLNRHLAVSGLEEFQK